jgi:hypothetical protein
MIFYTNVIHYSLIMNIYKCALKSQLEKSLHNAFRNNLYKISILCTSLNGSSNPGDKIKSQSHITLFMRMHYFSVMLNLHFLGFAIRKTTFNISFSMFRPKKLQYKIFQRKKCLNKFLLKLIINDDINSV